MADRREWSAEQEGERAAILLGSIFFCIQVSLGTIPSIFSSKLSGEQ